MTEEEWNPEETQEEYEKRIKKDKNETNLNLQPIRPCKR